jgi:hypothetical protein
MKRFISLYLTALDNYGTDSNNFITPGVVKTRRLKIHNHKAPILQQS